MAPAERVQRPLQDVGSGPEHVDPVALLARTPDKRVHEVDSGHALGQRPTEDAGGPHDGLAVCGDELAGLHRVPELLVVLEADELRCVDRHVLARLTKPNPTVDRGNRFVKRHGVDRAPEEVDARRRDDPLHGSVKHEMRPS